MATQVIMPQLGESVVEGTVTKWLKKEGETIAELDPLVEINTDKVDTEVPSPAAGVILHLYVGEGQTVRAGTLLAIIGQPGEPLPQAQAAPAMAEAGPQPRVEAPPPAPRSELGFISPVVARIASEHNLDLSRVRGTGQGGRITKKDVLAAVASVSAVSAPAPWDQPALGELFRPTEEVFGKPGGDAPLAAAGLAPGSVLPLDSVRRAIAEHMTLSKRTSPHVTTVMEADMSRVAAHRQAQRGAFERDGVNLTFTPYFVAAAVEALKAFPLVNSSWSDAGIVLHRAVNIGVAVSLGEKGLIVPVVKDADQKSLRRLAAEVNDLAGRARSRQLKPDEVQGGTFTITNHGTSGSLFATPIINQPQCAILGVGAIQKRVVVIDDAIAIRPMVYLSLTFDHRILDGASADGFLARVVQVLQSQPAN
jgi:2-oxoglutarate dehydrogenase E2 component (dihydrolipoamide succinyltransferase)